MAETHELRLKIDAGAAKNGAREFTGAIATIKKAVRDLERDTTGAFTKLKNIRPEYDVTPLTRARTETEKLSTASDKAAATIQRTALASASALRTSEQAAQRLALRMDDLGDARGIAQIDAALTRMQSNLVNATSTLDVRSAKSQFDDLRSSLLQNTVAAEHLRGEQAQLARQTEEAARAASTKAESLDRLRAKYNPLYSASKQYENALEEIALAEREGAISAQLAGDARQRAAQQLAGNTAAVDKHTASMKRSASTTQQGIMVGHQVSDVLVQAQMGFASVGQISLMQGSQLASQFAALKASGGSVFRTLLSGFTSLLSPLTLLTVGAVAVGTAIAKWFFAAGEETKSFSDALSDANSRISDLQRATSNMSGGNIRQLRREYGALNSELDAHLERLHKVAELNAATANSDMVASLRDALTSDGNLFTTDIDAIRRAFDTTNDRARIFLELMRGVESARTFEQQAEAVSKLRKAVEDTTGGLDRAEGGARGVLAQLVQAEDAALRLLAANNGNTDATRSSSSAASTLSAELGAAADAAADLLANLGSVPSALSTLQGSVTGQLASIAATNRSLELQISEGLSAAAANRTVQLQDMVNAAQSGGGVSFDQIANASAEIAALEAAAKQQSALQKQLRDQNKPDRKGGGGRIEALGDESRQLEKLSKQVNDRIFKLGQENAALDLLATGQATTRESAELMAAAMSLGGGAIDGQTSAMIRQFEAAQVLNEELRRLARDPVKDWIASVPSWTEAGQKIETQVFGSLSDAIANFAMTGKMDFEALGQSILSTATRIIADMAVKELIGMLGGNVAGGGGGGFNFGALIGSFFAAEGGLTSSPVAVNTGPMVSPAAFRHAPHFSEGTSNTSGIPAVLHPNEAVIPLSKGRKIPVEMAGGTSGGGTVINQPQTFNIQTKDADSFRRSQKQIAADAARSGRRAASQID
ncbi:phage tail tape measure protein, lambda family [Ruegeria halocynthiae]|uniref:Phage tail tape measure protein, lambda family n=1 Tax=Ruegeria halocynthiae TaxID=985054 RepID=A0A1H2W8I4_9RHOB|nr:phage tail tape measure C-terminal domain-containing protein [Ruegeria halocynthiae]SDW76983.1 phage tail tape measure protein, lambda family [Ruegeria halocynthiae]